MNYKTIKGDHFYFFAQPQGRGFTEFEFRLELSIKTKYQDFSVHETRIKVAFIAIGHDHFIIHNNIIIHIYSAFKK